MAFEDVMRRILTHVEPTQSPAPHEVSSGFFRDDGDLHAAVDFNFLDDSLDTFNEHQVRAPVDGTVVFRSQQDNLWGAVTVRAADGTYHRISR